MISDGCGYNHVDAASLYQHGNCGEQVYEKFPVKLAMATFMHKQSYNPDKSWRDFGYVSKGYTDSAAAATAMSTGVKTYKGAIGLDPNKLPVKHVVEFAEQRGKATGVLTSVQFSHATPAGFVAHNTNRGNYEEIAREMIYNSALEVIMGCGHPEYDDDGQPTGHKEYKYVGGKETWEDLKDGEVIGGDADDDGSRDKWTVVHDAADIWALMDGPTPKRVIAIAKKHKTLQQKRGGNAKAQPFEVPFNGDVPTLAEMTAAAINILDDDPDGFFLMIEGGAVDWAAHDNQSGRLIEEQIDFNRAVEQVTKWVAESSTWLETLVIVTADHECGYLTGPDSGERGERPVWNPVKNNGAHKVPDMEWHSSSHTNSLVPFYAIGAGADLFHRFAERTDPVRGRYLDNTSIHKVLTGLFGYSSSGQSADDDKTWSKPRKITSAVKDEK
jgi:alkaline phosphatase